MNNLEDCKRLCTAIRECNVVEYDDIGKTIILKDIGGEIEKLLGDLFVEFEKLLDSKILIQLGKIGNSYVFWDTKNFRLSSHSRVFDSELVVIINHNNNYLCYQSDIGITFVNGKVNSESRIIENAKYYFSLLRLFKEKSTNDKSNFHFVDFVNLDVRRILFVSENGRKLQINYSKGIPEISESLDLKKYYIELVEAFNDNNRHLPKFIKNELISNLILSSDEDKISDLISNLPEILRSALLSFDIYLNGLSIENIKKDYRKYKHEYLEELSGVLGKITTKIVALPIGISSVLFAIYKIEDSWYGLLILIISLFVISYFIGLLIRININDISDIRKSSTYDHEEFKKSLFFENNPSEMLDFENTYKDIVSRIDQVIQILNGYFWTLFLSNLFLVTYAFSKIIDGLYISVMIFLVGCIMIVFLRNYFLKINVPNNAPTPLS